MSASSAATDRATALEVPASAIREDASTDVEGICQYGRASQGEREGKQPRPCSLRGVNRSQRAAVLGEPLARG